MDIWVAVFAVLFNPPRIATPHSQVQRIYEEEQIVSNIALFDVILERRSWVLKFYFPFDTTGGVHENDSLSIELVPNLVR